jgi:hypothetical protein
MWTIENPPPHTLIDFLSILVGETGRTRRVGEGEEERVRVCVGVCARAHGGGGRTCPANTRERAVLQAAELDLS